MIRPTRAARHLIVVAVLLCGACDARTMDSAPTTMPPQQHYQNWPTLLDEFRFHWSSEPGIDVTVGPAMIVRAYMESYGTASYTLNKNNVYPGFTRATPENQTPTGDFLWQLVQVRPLGSGYPTTDKEARPHFGYQEFHILELEPIKPAGYRALVCSGEYAHFVRSTLQPTKFLSIGSREETAKPYAQGSSGVFPHRIELVQRDPREDAADEQPQLGKAPAPSDDVFGDWLITGASSSYWGPSTDRIAAAEFPSPAEKDRCENAMPTPRDERLALMTGFKDSPPPHGDPIPGWPAPGQ